QTRISDSVTGKTAKHYAVRHLQRFPPGTAYTEIRSQLAPRFAEPPLAGSHLVIDQTVTGRPVFLMFRRPAINVAARALTVTGGHSAGDDDHGGHLVPKKDLVGNLQVLFQARRLTIAESLPDAEVLAKELAAFQMKPAPLGDDVVQWREGPQDDLVLAVAIAAWQGGTPPALCTQTPH